MIAAALQDQACAPPDPSVPLAPTVPMRAGRSVPCDVYADIRRQMVLRFCKWDPQVGDVSTLAPFPLLLTHLAWDELCRSAELLAGELMMLERALVDRPHLHRRLAIPAGVRRALRTAARHGMPPAPVRVMRFDFHWTTEGWRASEVNSDVPGGYGEASAFPRLLAAHIGGVETAGDPAAVWADAVARAALPGGTAVLVAAPGFMEDQQVVSYLASRLAERGLNTHLADPMQLRWCDGRAGLAVAAADIPIDVLVRFYQAEWLAALPRRCGWDNLFSGSLTPVVNSASSVLTESKRLPLVWDDVGVSAPTWRRLLPETRDPRDAPWRRDQTWLLKAAFCNTGDAVAARSWLPSGQWRRTCLDVLLHPAQWIAQRRFLSRPIDTPAGDMYPCIGVYTVNGRAAGAYGRLSPRPVIDYQAVDVAVLVEPELDARWTDDP